MLRTSDSTLADSYTAGKHTLSPLYDVVPSITPRGVGSEFFLTMNIGEEGRLASLKNLCTSAPAFNLRPTESNRLTAQVLVARPWCTVKRPRTPG